MRLHRATMSTHPKSSWGSASVTQQLFGRRPALRVDRDELEILRASGGAGFEDDNPQHPVAVRGDDGLERGLAIGDRLSAARGRAA
jgi:hypothetical protein